MLAPVEAWPRLPPKPALMPGIVHTALVLDALSEADLSACLESARPRLVRMATFMLGDPDAAEDAFQDAAVKALSKRGSFRSEANVCTWVQRICVNTCHDRLRQRQSAEARDRALIREALWEDPQYTVDPEMVALAASQAEQLHRALLGLSPDQNRTVVLHDVDGWTAAEIAEMTATPLPTVKSHLRRGRQALVSLLAEAAG
jgi:RNA polymerase sigma-70 factor (ECF subfamily)